MTGTRELGAAANVAPPRKTATPEPPPFRMPKSWKPSPSTSLLFMVGFLYVGSLSLHQAR